MSISFPNATRSYDPVKGRVRFWGYDGAIEISFFLDDRALRKLCPESGDRHYTATVRHTALQRNVGHQRKFEKAEIVTFWGFAHQFAEPATLLVSVQRRISGAGRIRGPYELLFRRIGLPTDRNWPN